MKFGHTLGAAAAFMALAQASAAHAQQNCVDPADLSDTVIYTMPIAYDAARSACSDQLDPAGFLSNGSEDFIGQFRVLQDGAWPGTFRVLQTFIAADKSEEEEQGGPDFSAIIEDLPPEALRPLADGFIGQMIATEIKPDTCNKIERGMELLAPLPAENVGQLVAFITELANVKDPEICTVASQ